VPFDLLAGLALAAAFAAAFASASSASFANASFNLQLKQRRQETTQAIPKCRVSSATF
jgi:hypothetical protein